VSPSIVAVCSIPETLQNLAEVSRCFGVTV
jgi:hypothetical protein